MTQTEYLEKLEQENTELNEINVQLKQDMQKWIDKCFIDRKKVCIAQKFIQSIADQPSLSEMNGNVNLELDSIQYNDTIEAARKCIQEMELIK